MAEALWKARAVRRRGDAGTGRVLDTITLDREARYRRRVRMTTDSGRELLLDLSEATYLADGDALVTEGGLVAVRAAREPLMEVHGRDGMHLARIAWHIGNRHTPVEITADAIFLQPDHVLEEMIAGLDGHVHHVMRAFEPEGGAYGGHGALEQGHHHQGGQGQRHTHAHGHEESHDHAADRARTGPRVWKGGT